MSKKITLVVGGQSIAGQSSLNALNNLNEDSVLITTTSKENDVGGFDLTLKSIDLNQPGAAELIIGALNGQGIDKIDRLIYTPAFGPVGFPIEDAGDEHFEQAARFSLEPLRKLSEHYLPADVIGFSSFYWLPHITIAYGGMAAAKLGLESWALHHGLPGVNVKILRCGTFMSPSIRGICILIYREIKNTQNERLSRVGEQWKLSGMKFPEYFFQYAHGFERERYQPMFKENHRETSPEDITEGIHKLLTEKESAPITNIIGDWRWDEYSLPALGEEYHPAARWVDRCFAPVASVR